MGRAIPSFRISGIIEERKWKPFRNSLDKGDKKMFDEMFSLARQYNSASYHCVRPYQNTTYFDVHHISSLQKLFQLSKINIKFAEIDLNLNVI